jgi:feruloyl esterase
MRNRATAFVRRSPSSIYYLAYSIITLFGLGVGQAPAAIPCANLMSVQLPDATVTSAVTMSGNVTGPDGQNYTGLPSFCQVTIVATPSSDSLINILLWLPDNTWNGRFQGTGNGGYAGNMAIDAFAMVYAIKHGFAVAATDMGTAPSANNNADTLIGHPQKWIDWGYRSTYLMTVLGKRVLKAFQGREPRFSYFNGCSTGGQQALLLAQKYPRLYDGILAGAPAHDRTHVHSAVLWLFQKTHEKPTSYITSDKVTLINNAIIAACRAKSGGAPGDTWLTDPRKCDWKPRELRCTSGVQTNCLNDDQVKAATAIYAGPRDSVTGERIFPGAAKGSEASSSFGWNALQSGVEPNFGSLFKWVFGPTWTYRNFDWHSDMIDLDFVLARMLNVTNPDLSKFREGGGKLLMYHGWADPLIAPQSSVDYYNNVLKLENSDPGTAGKTRNYFRLFMAPGMNHCYGGPGPHVFGNQYSGNIVTVDPPVDNAKHHVLKALMAWVERGEAPNQIIATKYLNDTAPTIAMQRPLCPFPKAATYDGVGPVTAASSFSCQ